LHPFLTPAGTLGYKAPEVFKGSYSLKADIWSIGVVAYILLCGFPPYFSCQYYIKDVNMLCDYPFWVFFNQETEELLQAIQSGKINFPSPFWDFVSQDAKNFVSSLLVVDPDTRASAEEALAHPWMTETPASNTELETSRKNTNNLKKLEQVLQTAQGCLEENNVSQITDEGYLRERKNSLGSLLEIDSCYLSNKSLTQKKDGNIKRRQSC